MFSTQHRTGSPRLTAWGSAALLALMFVPAAALAQNPVLVVRNDTPMAVVVHASTVCRGVVARARPALLNPKASAPINLPGNKVITIYDARFPTRILYRDTLPPTTQNRTLSIQPDPPGLKLVPVP
jgi:hypothetical protein